MKLSRIVYWSIAMACLVASLAGAQVSVVPASGTPPVSYASMTEVNALVAQLNSASQALDGDLGKVRVEKWKTDGDTKRQSLANVESIQRNLQSAFIFIRRRFPEWEERWQPRGSTT